MAIDSSSKNFQDFDPRFEWLHHPDSHVLIVHLLGFRSNQLKVQVTSTGKLRISGERRLGSGKWLRFHKEIDVPTDADTDNISAKLEEGILYVKQPIKPSATSSTNPPDQKPKPTAQPQPQPPPTAAAAKPKEANPQPPAEPRKPAPTKADPIRQNAPKSQIERPQSQPRGKQIPTPTKPMEAPKPKEATETAAVDRTKLPAADPPTVRQNAPMTQNDKSQAEADKKQIPTPQMLQNRTEKEKQTEEEEEEEKAKSHTKLKEALEKTRDEEEGSGSKMEEEGSHGRGDQKEGGEVAEERRRRRRRKRSEEMVRRREGGYKQVIDGVVKELRTNMVTLVLGVAVFVIVYLNVTNKGHVEEEL